ncbi:MAG: helix-turn-helix domain-containing protein [Oscillospiraceae bacterium]|nr:helix-turn-helix domain-containing protein [Oscillospiraceae bacterium]
MNNIFSDFPDVMSVDDLCHALNIGKNTAYKLLNKGDIKSVRIGKTHKIPKSRVINYIQN